MAGVLSFYLVEEGILKNKESVDLQESIALMLWERASAEVAYVRNIEDWKRDVISKIDNWELSKKDAFDFILPMLIKEANDSIAAHQDAYQRLMSDNGPYVSLKRNVTVEQDRNNKTRLMEIEREFRKFDHRRRSLEIDNKQHKQAIDKMKATLIGLEDQLSKRSRVTDGRKSARGARKLDSILARVSKLRRNIDMTNKTCNKGESELSTLIKDKQVTLKRMFKDLKTMDKERIALIHKEMMMYAQEVSSTNTKRNRENSEFEKLQNTNIGEIHEKHWIQIEERASLKKSGIMLGVDMFQTNSSRPNTREDVLSRNESRGDTDSVESTPRNKSAHQSIAEIHSTEKRTSLPDKTDSVHTLHNLITCSNDSCTTRGSNKGSFTEITIRPLTVTTINSGSFSDAKVEVMELPKESSVQLPPPFTTKVFCPSDDDEEEIISQKTLIEFDSSNVRLVTRITDCRSNTSTPVLVDGDIGACRNISVVATTDYVARNTNELSLKKGQTVKQKIGENEEGFAYGWTRDGKLMPKRYGWYPASLVSFK